MAAKEKSPEGEFVTLKIRFNPEEHKKLKIAAAELEITIAEFMKSAVLGASERAVKNYYQRELGPKRRSKQNPSDE